MKNLLCRSLLIPLVALVCFAIAPTTLRAADEGKPNIVFFITDDYGWQDTSEPMWENRTEFNDRFRTPNMEKLAKQGVKFTTAYTACSVCTASRISILTGQNPVRHGTTFIIGTPGVNSKTMRSAVQDNDGIQKDDTVLPALLKKSGYRTICIGKAHFGDGDKFAGDPRNLDFDRIHYANHYGSPVGKDFGGNDAYHVDRGGEQVHLSEALTLEAKAEIREAVQDDKPFFLYLSHYAVHTPILEDKRFSQNYPNLTGRDRAYATLVEGADKSLGDVMTQLKELGVAKNTLVIWTADNGSLWSNAPLKGSKNDAYEGGHRVPNLIAWGEQDNSLAYQQRMPLAPGRVDDRPFIHQDWMPTLLRLAGTEHPNPDVLDGYDITDLLAGKGQDVRPDLFFWHEPNFWAHSGPESSVRENNWKLIYFYATKTWELYDLSEDIGERSNLVGKYPEKAAAMAEKLINHLTSNNANYPTDIESGEELPPRWQ
ncbi:Arylsulfatase [Rubripirellula obstinata]|uniref:Arylsulfatase n=1 Tax=Rubripirellula obstinata TaxID=406547 RepID=A0A5B1CMF0_9BACT|nr:sulfatase [Rubripirellula obstinata]KAA1260730.1 Arylsulfatase [Rubripirellula obstinata]